MKHIKHINEGFNQDDYYVNISHDEYEEYSDTDDNKQIFNSKEVDFFNNNTTVLNWRKFIRATSITKSFDNSHWVRVLSAKASGGLPIQTDIIKLKDSYYLVDYDVRLSLSRRYQLYKCDQFEGLVKLLKDKGVIK